MYSTHVKVHDMIEHVVATFGSNKATLKGKEKPPGIFLLHIYTYIYTHRFHTHIYIYIAQM